jgi:hypothetical protein
MCLPDHNPGFPDDLPIRNDIGAETGDVDDDKIIVDAFKDPSRAFQRQPQLLNPFLDRFIERPHRCRADDAVGFQSVPSLKVAHGILQTSIYDRRLGIGFRVVEVAGNRKSCCQRRNALVVSSMFE